MAVVEKIYEHISVEGRTTVQAYNRASEIGHPCLRYLYYSRACWDQRQLPSLRRRLLFREGERQEIATIIDLLEAGFRVEQAQRDFANKELQLVGHPDGFIEVNDQKVVLEVKAVNPYSWQRIQKAKDLLNGRFWWERMWYWQVQAYLMLTERSRALLLLKNKITGELKEIWVPADDQIQDAITQKCFLVNKAVENEEAPERPEDLDEMVCRDCDFFHICLPDVVREPIEVRGDEDEIAELLEERERLREAYERYQEITELLKKKLEGVKRLIVGNWLIEGKEVHRKAYTVPETTYWKLSFKKIR